MRLPHLAIVRFAMTNNGRFVNRPYDYTPVQLPRFLPNPTIV